jgi:phosphoesterase RecJ-like protein
MACADPVPDRFDFLPGVQEVSPVTPRDEDIIVAVDSSDIERIGFLYDAAAFGSRPVINIDHHVTNTYFGTVNLVRPVPSTAEIVYDLVQHLGVPLDKDIASPLLTGLVTDTLCFRTGNVTTQQLHTAIALMDSGASLTDITELVFNRRPLSTICLWGQALSTVQTDGQLLWAEVDQNMLHKCGASLNDGTGLVSLLASTRGVNVAIVFSEKGDGHIDVSMRARPGWDVSGVAASLGGGGHPRAAGCLIAGDMRSVRKRVLHEIRAFLEDRGEPTS